MPFDLERDDDLADLFESETADDELKDRLRQPSPRIRLAPELLLDDEPDEK